MIFIHELNESALPPLGDRIVCERHKGLPTVIPNGARQTGKTTYPRDVVETDRHCWSLVIVGELTISKYWTRHAEIRTARGRQS